MRCPKTIGFRNPTASVMFWDPREGLHEVFDHHTGCRIPTASDWCSQTPHANPLHGVPEHQSLAVGFRQPAMVVLGPQNRVCMTCLKTNRLGVPEQPRVAVLGFQRGFACGVSNTSCKPFLGSQNSHACLFWDSREGLHEVFQTPIVSQTDSQRGVPEHQSWLSDSEMILVFETPIVSESDSQRGVLGPQSWLCMRCPKTIGFQTPHAQPVWCSGSLERVCTRLFENQSFRIPTASDWCFQTPERVCMRYLQTNRLGVPEQPRWLFWDSRKGLHEVFENQSFRNATTSVAFWGPRDATHELIGFR